MRRRHASIEERMTRETAFELALPVGALTALIGVFLLTLWLFGQAVTR